MRFYITPLTRSMKAACELKDLCTYVSLDCKTPSENNYDKQFINQRYFVFDCEGTSTQIEPTDKKQFDPLDMMYIDQKKKERELDPLDQEIGHDDFVYISFESKLGCDIEVSIKIVGQLKPEFEPQDAQHKIQIKRDGEANVTKFDSKFEENQYYEKINKQL